MKTSFVWNYFVIDKNQAICQVKISEHQICLQRMSYKGSSTSSLSKHLKNIHGIHGKTETKEESKQTTLFSGNFIKPMSIQELVSRAVIQDRTSMNALTTSIVAKYAGMFLKVKVPTSGNTIRSYILRFYQIKRRELKNHIKTLKNNGSRFSITTDEWSDMVSKRRFITVTLQSNKENFCLGLGVSFFFFF